MSITCTNLYLQLVSKTNITLSHTILLEKFLENSSTIQNLIISTPTQSPFGAIIHYKTSTPSFIFWYYEYNTNHFIFWYKRCSQEFLHINLDIVCSQTKFLAYFHKAKQEISANQKKKKKIKYPKENTNRFPLQTIEQKMLHSTPFFFFFPSFPFSRLFLFVFLSKVALKVFSILWPKRKSANDKNAALDLLSILELLTILLASSFTKKDPFTIFKNEWAYTVVQSNQKFYVSLEETKVIFPQFKSGPVFMNMSNKYKY